MGNQIVIIGAGLAGLLAGNMLRRQPLAILEAQSGLPNNHHAVLRFRTDKVALQTGIRFRRVRVFKAIHNPINPVSDALAYSHKVTGRLELRSVIDTAPVDRYVAPTDLVTQMADGLPISFNRSVDAQELAGLANAGAAIISTIPMPYLMDLLHYDGPRPDFSYRAGSVVKVQLHSSDVFASIYYPYSHHLSDPISGGVYRASITGSELAIELVKPPLSDGHAETAVVEVLRSFGLMPEAADMSTLRSIATPYAKLARLSDEDRRRARDFMFWATTHHRVYSLGRFATWRAGLLLDDVVDDVAKIEGWMRSGHYDLRKDV